jgi:pyridinium-3,5-bisthiocarboxylic acid mononucleotide nickel chelatase
MGSDFVFSGSLAMMQRYDQSEKVKVAMTILYLDATAGIAGDMTVAALLDLGLPLEHLNNELAKLGLPDGSYRLSEEQVQRGGMTGRHFTVHLPHSHEHHDHGHHHHHRTMLIFGR